MISQTRLDKDIFSYQGISLRNRDSAFKIATDSLLLGDWADVSESQKILDVGCGTGVIGLLMASRSTSAHVTLLEKDYQSYLEAHENALSCTFWNRTSVIFSEFKIIGGLEASFDHIVCNPPYFEKAQLGPSQRKNDARHSLSLPAEELFELSYKITSPEAKLSLIYPYQQKNQLTYLIRNEWIMSRECEVIGKSGKCALVLYEFQKNSGEVERSTLDLRQKKSPRKTV